MQSIKILIAVHTGSTVEVMCSSFLRTVLTLRARRLLLLVSWPDPPGRGLRANQTRTSFKVSQQEFCTG